MLEALLIAADVRREGLDFIGLMSSAPWSLASESPRAGAMGDVAMRDNKKFIKILMEYFFSSAKFAHSQMDEKGAG